MQHNVLIGRVDAGKSSILNALALVLDADVGRRYRPVEEMDFYQGRMIDDEGKPLSIDIEVTLSHCSPEEKNQFFEYWEPWDVEKAELIERAEDISILDDKKNAFAFRIAFKAEYDLNEKEIISLWYYPKSSFIGGNSERRMCPRTDRERVGFFLIPAERDISKALSFTRHSALDRALRHDKIGLDQEITKIAGTLEGAGAFFFENEQFEGLIKEVERSVEKLLHLSQDSSRKLTFEVSGLGHYDIMNILRAFVVPEGAPRAYPIANQGAGAKQVIVLATLRMLAARKKSCIIAIEEPEVGLHPYMQRGLIRDILGASCQTLIATHSTHVAQVAGKDALHLLIDAQDGEKTVRNTAPCQNIGCSADTIRAVRRISGHYPLDMLECLFAPRVLLVEGAGDREAVPELLRKLNDLDRTKYDLDSLGIGVMPCEGKEAIPRMAPYFRALNKKVYSLVDNETSTASSNSLIFSACDCTFLWPDKTAIEKILVESAGEDTLDTFIGEVTDHGDSYFATAGTAGKEFAGKKEDVFRYLKSRKIGHKHFASLVPPGKIAESVKRLSEKLNKLCGGEDLGREVRLGDQ
jgi:putative ATP-dependent endonuclease of OLD family